MLHFSEFEFSRRSSLLSERLDQEGLDAILLFAPESHFWLTGYDTFGFCFFQCLIYGQNEPVLLTRSADFLQAKITSNIKDVRIWIDNDDANPAIDLADILNELGLYGKRIGIETDTHGLTGMNYRRVTQQLSEHVTLIEASNIVSKLRLVKSDEELVYVRKAAELADEALDAAVTNAKPGVDEGIILAAMHNTIFAGGGDYPGNEFIIGSSKKALLVRYAAGTRKLDANDQLNLEWAGVYRHYHVAMMRTVILGKANPRQFDMYYAGTDALNACEEELKPGTPMETVYDAHCRSFESAGMGNFRLNACGYSLGARYTPTWMEREMFRPGAQTIIQSGMVFFLHMILLDSDKGLAMCIGRTSLVTDRASEPLSKHNLDLIVV